MAVLTLLRHAKAAQPLSGQDDFDRPLTERGRDDAAWAGTTLSAYNVDSALVSAARRTRETWEVAGSLLTPPPAAVIEEDLYLCSSGTLIAKLREIPADTRSVVAVGHNPCMQEVAHWLARRSAGSYAAAIREKFPTCAMAIFELEDGMWDRLSPEHVTFKRLLTPSRTD